MVPLPIRFADREDSPQRLGVAVGGAGEAGLTEEGGWGVEVDVEGELDGPDAGVAEALLGFGEEAGAEALAAVILGDLEQSDAALRAVLERGHARPGDGADEAVLLGHQRCLVVADGGREAVGQSGGGDADQLGEGGGVAAGPVADGGFRF